MGFQPKVQLWVSLSLAFLLTTIIGTVSHEAGHFVMAEGLGYSADMSFNYTSIEDSDQAVSSRDRFLITLAGPLQTILTGTLGLILVYRQRNYYRNKTVLSVGKWCLIFLALFWIRPTINLISQTLIFMMKHHLSSEGDEFRLAAALHLPAWSLSLTCGLAGALVFTLVFFGFVPRTVRTTFLLSGLTGGGLGYLIWVKLL